VRPDDRERGAVLVIVALSLGFLITITAVTVDLGRLSLRRRDMQAVADVVALDMARLVNGRTTQEILTESDPSWTDSLDQSAARNDFSSSKLGYTFGDMNGSTFVENNAAAHRPTAVQITATDDIAYFFAPGGGEVSRQAVGSLGDSACFTVGSFAAAITATPTSFLPGLLNSALGVDIASYDGLANAQVTLGDIASNLGLGSPTDLFNSTVNERDFFIASAQALSQAGDTADAAVLNSIASQTRSTSTFQFGDLIAIQQGGQDAALSSAFNVLDLVAGTAFLVNGSSALAIPDLGVVLPGLASATASVSIIQRPDRACTGVNETPGATTSQLALTLDLGVQAGPFAVANVEITVDMASATGVLVDPLSCGPPAIVNVNVQGSLVTTSINQTILGVTTTLVPPAHGVGASIVSFTLPPDSYDQFKRTGSGSIGLATTDLSVLAPGVQVSLNASLPIIDSLLVSPLFSDFAGLTVAGADVAAHSTSCNDVLLAK
jgi:uncharacterized membrane protein